MIPRQIEEFLSSKNPNQWLSIGPLEIYVRQAVRINPKAKGLIRTFDIANVSCGQKDCGIFSNIFDSLNELSSYGFGAIYIEQVLTDRFAEYFRRKNCIEVKSIGNIPSFFYFLNN